MDWTSFKVALSAVSGLSHDAFHILAGVLALLLFAALLRLSVANLLPFGAVLAVALLNELLDLEQEIWPGPSRAAQWGESFKDIVVTMALPILLLMLARWVPRLLVGSGARSADSRPLGSGQEPLDSAAE